MNDTVLSKSFLDAQRERLVALRKQLIGTADDAGNEEGLLQQTAGGEPQDSGDDAERFAQQDRDESILSHNEGRIAVVDRALEKLDEGTYGISDGNGETISKARLEAIPETIYTLEEMEARERAERNAR
jgi:DnaK suppressor protein